MKLLFATALIFVAIPAAADPPIPQVLIGVRFAEISSDSLSKLGVDFGTKVGFEVGADFKIPAGHVAKNLSVSFRPGVLFTGS
jgi:Flp pilus assembly secretin CpaC